MLKLLRLKALGLIVASLLILSACTTIVRVPVINEIQVSEDLKKPCAELPLITAKAGSNLEEAVLLNRVESEAVLATCAAKHLGVLTAAGLKLKPSNLTRWEIFKTKLPKFNKE